MKIVFFPVDCCPFEGNTLSERPLGGTETAVIHLSKALQALGHEVFVVTSVEDPADAEGFPRYITAKQANALGLIDVLVVVRGLKGVFLPFNVKKRFFWTGDSWDNPHTYGIGDLRYIRHLDGLLAVSNWHAETLCKASGFPLEKTFVLRNGINLKDFEGLENRKRKRLIYSSTPNRGLVYLPEIYKGIKEKHPDAELHVFSSMNIYAHYWPPYHSMDEKNSEIFSRLDALDGCQRHGSLLQSGLAREFMKSAVLAYPCDFEETSCITAMEAQAAGCAVVTTDLAALRETIGDAGILIDEMPGSECYQRKFIHALDRIFSDAEAFEKLSLAGKEMAKSNDWSHRAREFLAFLNKASIRNDA